MIQINKLLGCINCCGTGIWKGEFHSSVCSACDGLGLLSLDQEQIEFNFAVKLLKLRHKQLRMEFQNIQRLSPDPVAANFKKKTSNPLNSTYTHDKTQPLFWEPSSYCVCHECNGSGMYVGIVSTTDCGLCNTSGIVGAYSSELEPYEQIAILGMRNKVLKRRVKILRSQPGVEEELKRIELNRIREEMR